jgi:glyoxylase-like metal-dependent hydrolase (beta-lactamase superfamily II)
VGDLNFERIDTPGHDPWHVAWREQRTGLLFVGDTLLGLPTPIMEPLLDDLTPYRDSLRRLSRLSDVSLVLPGHGRAWTSLADAVSMSWSHVERVAAAVRSALLLGPTDIGEVAASLLDPERPDLKRAFIWISNVHAQLAEWQRMGLCTVRDDRRWVQTGALPEVEHLS